MKKSVLSLAFVLIYFIAFSQFWKETKKTVAFDRHVDDYLGWSVSIDGDFAVIGVPYQDYDENGQNYLLNAGAAYVYKFVDGEWVFHQKLVSNIRRSQDNFGYSVCIKGDYIIVGATKNAYDSNELDAKINAGAVYVFKNIAGNWIFQQKIVANDRQAQDQFGYSVAIDGNYIVVGAVYQDFDNGMLDEIQDAGAAYIFKYNSGNWTQIKKLFSTNRSVNEYFGNAVSIDGEYIVVGSYFHDYDASGSVFVNNSGAAFVYKNNSDAWNLVEKLTVLDRQENDLFGCSVAISGDYIIAGAYAHDYNLTGGEFMSEAGAAYIFKNNFGTWIQHQKIIAPNPDRAAGDRFGFSVSISNGIMVVGAYLQEYDDYNSGIDYYNAGAAYIFKENSGNWEYKQKIINSDREAQDYFAYSVGISGEYIICGAYQEAHNENGENPLSMAGSAYIFFNSPDIAVVNQSYVINNGGTFDFGGVLFGESSGNLEFHIENNGETDLILKSNPKITISGSDASEFYLNQTGVISPVTPGNYTSFSISFNPATPGEKNAQISILNNDPENKNYLINLTGIGNKIPQVITNFDEIPVKTYGDDSFGVSATASSGLPVVFSSSNPAIASCSGPNGTIITIHSAGTCEIYANQPGNEFYDAAPQISRILTVNKKVITITPYAQTKIYGDSDPIFTYTNSPGLMAGDSFSGALQREPGENVGIYYITLGTLFAGNNYELFLEPEVFEIIQRSIIVNVDPNQSKIYQYSDPVFTYTYIGQLIGADNFTGSLSRESGENVGYYIITQGNLSLGTNYHIIFNSQMFQIFPRQIAVTANSGIQKTYGMPDPTFGYTFSGSIYMGDGFTGSLSREPGENVGTYPITIGTLTLGPNYEITFNSALFTINPKSLTVVVYPGQNKIYGDEDPVFNYWLMGTLEPGDSFGGQLGREPGENIGFYQINMGTLTAGPNYNLSLNSNNFEIKKRYITVNVTPGQSKQYGDPDPIFEFTTNIPIAPWDSFTGQLSRTPGESIGNYPINQGTLSLNSNYQIVFNSENFSITKRNLLIIPDPNQGKVYGDADPVLTYTFTGGLVVGDSFSGNLARTWGEDVGVYPINLGTLTVNSNYLLILQPENFTVYHRQITVIPDEELQKVYGEIDPAITYTYSGEILASDNFTGNLQRESGENVGTYAITIGTLAINSNYNIYLLPASFEILPRQTNITALPGQNKIYGDSDPDEFSYSVTPQIAGWDSFTGKLQRVPGESVGTYQIQLGNLALNSNYIITYVPADFEILKKEINVYCAENQYKIYGEGDPAYFEYSYSPELSFNDSFEGELSREPGENVGFYQILQGTLQLNENYEINYHPGYFEIRKADPQIFWENPQDIYYGTALSELQLNASANIPGIFVYDPDFGTILPVGDNQELKAYFYPQDETNYNNAEEVVYINVLFNTALNSVVNNNLNVYPNPAKDFVNVDASENGFTYRIIDIHGKIKISGESQSALFKIDLSELVPGIYYIIIDNETFKIVKI
ncbi:MAG TPA: MBG domain-containing protein [Bacteroidales bacterium]|nr:MBG domain-containing protein [Bacteroidales bacterium]